MGFMGFGMQKWIYTMRPRKPFSMQRKASFTVIPTYNRKFKLQPSNKSTGFNFGLILLVIFAIITISAIPNFMSYSMKQNKAELDYRISRDKQAFDFLMTSGTNRLKKGNISGAYSEFKLAVAIIPNNNEANQLLLETIGILCQENDSSCKEFDNL